jgi:hypothetical protein
VRKITPSAKVGTKGEGEGDGATVSVSLGLADLAPPPAVDTDLVETKEEIIRKELKRQFFAQHAGLANVVNFVVEAVSARAAAHAERLLAPAFVLQVHTHTHIYTHTHTHTHIHTHTHTHTHIHTQF